MLTRANATQDVAQLTNNHSAILYSPNETSSENQTYVVWPWGDSLYPSGYTTLWVIITALLVTVLMIITVVGNMLVIIAIATERALKGLQNWLIASLAVSDLLLGIIVMPFSLANELMGYWIFGQWWCEIHAATDVLLCTASIMNICLISLDRYWSITQAVDYLKKRTPLRTAIMIAMVWLLSGLISIPPLLGWKNSPSKDDFPKCQLSDDIGYVIYSALGSFYIPSCIMLFVYIRIYFAARKRARRAVKKPVRNPPPSAVSMAPVSAVRTPVELPVNNPPSAVYFKPPSEIPEKDKKCRKFLYCKGPEGSKESFTILETGCDLDGNSEPPPKSLLQVPSWKKFSNTSNNLFPRNDRKSDALDSLELRPLVSNSCNIGQFNTISVDTRFDFSYRRSHSTKRNFWKSFDCVYEKKGLLEHASRRSSCPIDPVISKASDVSSKASPLCIAPLIKSTDNTLSASIDSHKENMNGNAIKQSIIPNCTPCHEELGSEAEHSSESVTRNKTCRPLKLKICKNMFGNKKSSKAKRQTLDIGKVTPKINDPQREKRRIAKKREKRATLILGLIMGSFIMCWLPFFILYVLQALCKECNVASWGFATAFWLGYANSALNPIIYTLFNKDFRRAFRKILFT